MILVALCSESSQLLAWTRSCRRCFWFHSDLVVVPSISIMAACHVLLVERFAVWMAVKFFFSLIVESTENLYAVCLLLEICVKYSGANHRFKTHIRFYFFRKHRQILNIFIYVLKG